MSPKLLTQCFIVPDATRNSSLATPSFLQNDVSKEIQTLSLHKSRAVIFPQFPVPNAMCTRSRKKEVSKLVRNGNDLLNVNPRRPPSIRLVNLHCRRNPDVAEYSLYIYSILNAITCYPFSTYANFLLIFSQQFMLLNRSVSIFISTGA